MIKAETALMIEGSKPIVIRDVFIGWERVGEIDRELKRDMLPMIRQRRLSERKHILNSFRISYT